jgi:hypothetical protein
MISLILTPTSKTKVTLAKDVLQRALATGVEKEVRMAIKYGVKAGLRGQMDDGSTYCTELLKQVYKMQTALENSAKEQKAQAAHEKELGELCVRSTPLGSDRFHRRYWVFSHSQYDEQRLFVEGDTSLCCCKGGELIGTISTGEIAVETTERTAKQVCSIYGNTFAGSIKVAKAPTAKQLDRSVDLPDFILSAAKEGGGTDLKGDQPLCRLIASRPSARISKWGVYTANELWSLCEALDDRGEREKELKAAIKARFDITEPPVVFFKSGSEHIGKAVVRTFGKKVSSVVTFLHFSSSTDQLQHYSNFSCCLYPLF